MQRPWSLAPLRCSDTRLTGRSRDCDRQGQQGCASGRRRLGVVTFEGEEGREAHLNGQIPAALGQVGPDLLASDPDIRPTDIIAMK